MEEKLHRLKNGERWWAAEIALRGFGLCLLVLCAAVCLLLYHSIHQGQRHEAYAREYGEALVVMATLSSGGAFLTCGPGLFERIALSGRHTRFSVTKGDDR